MASWHPKRCKHCGAEAADGFRISKRGLCEVCGMARMTAAVVAAQDGADAAVADRAAELRADRTA